MSWYEDLISSVQTMINNAIDESVDNKINGPNGLAGTDAQSKVPVENLPANYGVSENTILSSMSQLQQYQQTTPTLEELCVSGTMDAWDAKRGKETATSWPKSTVPTPLADANRMTIFVPPFPVKILSFALSWDYWTLPGNNTNYWTATLEHGSQTSFSPLAARNTKLIGTDANGGITARKPWTFDAASWSNATVPAGNVVCLTVSPSQNSVSSGSNTLQSSRAFGFPFTWTLRYCPV